MNKTIIYVLVSLIVGIVIGAFAMLIAFPFLFPPAEVNETVADVGHKTVVAGGTFIHPDPSDKAHWGKGGVTVYQQDSGIEVYLEPDFEVGPGPYYFVYLSSGVEIFSNDDFEVAHNVEVGRLKSFRGGQIYAVNAYDPATMKSVVVWCKTFGQLITSARLQP